MYYMRKLWFYYYYFIVLRPRRGVRRERNKTRARARADNRRAKGQSHKSRPGRVEVLAGSSQAGDGTEIKGTSDINNLTVLAINGRGDRRRLLAFVTAKRRIGGGGATLD